MRWQESLCHATYPATYGGGAAPTRAFTLNGGAVSEFDPKNLQRVSTIKIVRPFFVDRDHDRSTAMAPKFSYGW
mgnify:FL=1